MLDLRGNRGGVLRQAVTAADTLLPAGIVAITAGRYPDANRIWESGAGELAAGMPVVVIVDGRSASAAEVLAAGLADRGRGVVIGSSTLGKGLVQTITPLPDGGELFVTWSRILAPRGWPIQGLGCSAAGLHKPRAECPECAACDAGAGPPADGRSAGDPQGGTGAAAADPDPDNSAVLSGSRRPGNGSKYRPIADPRPRRLRCRPAAADQGDRPVILGSRPR